MQKLNFNFTIKPLKTPAEKHPQPQRRMHLAVVGEGVFAVLLVFCLLLAEAENFRLAAAAEATETAAGRIARFKRMDKKVRLKLNSENLFIK
jgi:hypothetical protein